MYAVPDEHNQGPKCDPRPEPLARLTEEQQESFIRVEGTLPRHLHSICFDLQGDGWTPTVTTELAGILRECTDVVSASSTNFGSCSLFPFPSNLPEDTPPVASDPY